MSGITTCAVFADGTAKCVGYNGYGSIGDGTETDRTTPVPVTGLSDALAIGIGWSHACALRKGGLVSCWGRNSGGQLNDGTTKDRYLAGPVPSITDARTLNVGAYQPCVVRDAGGACWAPTDSLAPLTDIAEVQAGNVHRCARTKAGAIYCWGTNTDGVLGDGTKTNRTVPTRVIGF
jgi:alpha-tubulin suppressor-like RCC1 family protein